MRLPSHIAIIPDGNRRWAVNHNLNKADGYDYGLSPGLSVLRLAKKLGISEITYYGFTVDNCKRPPEQLKAFSKACVDAISLIAQEGCSLLVIGNTKSKCFPKELLPYTKRTDINGGGIKVNFLVNYGWEWDLSGLEQKEKDKKPFSAIHSRDISRIDLIIRWGGMRRLSGLLPVQSVYSDFYIVDEMWPDFKEEQFSQALLWYDRQDVTLGG
ncbi:undecaprenyl diphosphate synthase family protein [Konateibacter massiliensis]|uniref:undecaprenyl diphosphate synthase family protein n=1 Tax=Konateibacter massiliensis TaxID=2002841 RepID=UPI000C144762|nr:undecaprenyl diphosphate synthase family protein [Konateibacter massiliensis]